MFEIAKFFHVEEHTIGRRRHTRGEFDQGTRAGSEIVNRQGKDSLYRLAVGYCI